MKIERMTNPSALLRYRDSIYAEDLLMCAVAYFDFFTYLDASERSFDEICNDLKIVSRPADVMLTLFAAKGLIDRKEDKFVLTPLAKDYLVSNKYWSLVPYYASLKNRPQCREFHNVLLTGNPAGWASTDGGNDWIEAMKDASFANEFTAAMDSRGAYLAYKLSEVLDMRNFHTLLDIAGGSGIYACTLVNENRNIKATVLEVPPVDEASRRSITKKQMSEKVDVIAGDMFDAIPDDYDIHLLANVLHDWDLKTNQELVGMSYQAINKGGKIVVFDAHLNEEKNGPLVVAEYSCMLMHSTKGRCYSTQEIEELLLGVGYVDVKVKRVVAGRSKISARKE
jgi:hypothetical protein